MQVGENLKNYNSKCVETKWATIRTATTVSRPFCRDTHQNNPSTYVKDSVFDSTCRGPVLNISCAVHDGIVVAVVRGAERVARAQPAEVRALRRPAHAHAADEPTPGAHHLPHRRC